MILHPIMHFTELFFYLAGRFIDRYHKMKDEPVSEVDQKGI